MSGYDSIILADTPWGYWPQSDALNSTAVADASGNGRNGTVAGGVTFGQSSLVAGDPTATAALYDGSTGVVTLPQTGLPTGAAPWSIETWVKLSTLTPVHTRGVPIGFGTYASVEMGELQYYSGQQQWVLSCYGHDYASAPNTATLTPTHLVGAYDGTATHLYVNGVQVGGGTVALNIVVSFASLGAGNSSPTDFFAGVNAKSAFYTYALTPTQVQAHYVAGVAAGILGAGAAATSGVVMLERGAVAASASGLSATPSLLASGALGGQATLTAILSRLAVATVSGVVLLPNAYLATERATYNAGTQSTGGYTAHLAGVLTHIEPTKANAYTVLPDGALVGDYTATVASGADIAVGDRLSAFTLLDGVTPWPGEWLSGSANEYFVVTLVRESAPFFLPQRLVYLKRMTGGGPAHI